MCIDNTRDRLAATSGRKIHKFLLTGVVWVDVYMGQNKWRDKMNIWWMQVTSSPNSAFKGKARDLSLNHGAGCGTRTTEHQRMQTAVVLVSSCAPLLPLPSCYCDGGPKATYAFPTGQSLTHLSLPRRAWDPRDQVTPKLEPPQGCYQAQAGACRAWRRGAALAGFESCLNTCGLPYLISKF